MMLSSGGFDEMPTVTVGSLRTSPLVVLCDLVLMICVGTTVPLLMKLLVGCGLTADEGLLGGWGGGVGAGGG